MPSDDRERSFENALARHLQPAAPRAACPDAETLAVYHERSLAPELMVAVQAHLGDCQHCRQILAHLQATDDIPSPVTRIPAPQTAAAKSGVHGFPARKLRFGIWVAPAGALAAGLLIWVTIHESSSGRFGKPRLPAQAQPIEIAQTQPSATSRLSADISSGDESRSAGTLGRLDNVQPSLSKIAPIPQRSQPLTKEKDFPGTRKSPASNGVAGALEAASPRLANPAASHPALQPQLPRSVTQTVEVEPPNNELAATQSAAGGPPATESKAKSENAKRDKAYLAPSSAPAITGGAPVPAPAAPPPSSQSVQVTTESTEAVQNRAVANSAHLNPSAQLLLASSTAGVTVSAPDGRASWRIGQGGVILFSSDAGKTWSVQPSGLITDLLSGSAPSARVCWLVGRSGTILLTTDKGKHWHKVQPPTQDDFLSVFAVNARQATVSPASGAYQTTDGGATWNKLSPE